MDYKVGDEVLVRGKIDMVDLENDRVTIAFPNDPKDGFILRYWFDASLVSKPSTVIFDPISSEAQALIGQEVVFSDQWDFYEKYYGVLYRANKDHSLPFVRQDGLGFQFIRPIAQPETISREDAEAELEKALGKKVRIEG